MRKTAILTAALLALLVLPALAVFGPGAGPALAQGAQKDKAAKTGAPGGVSGTVVSVQNGVLTVTTAQNRAVRLSTDRNTLVLKGGMASVSALRAGDRVLVNPEFRPIPNGNGKTQPATDPSDNKSATKPSSGSSHLGNNGMGSESAAPQPSGDRGAASGQQTKPDDKSVPVGSSRPPDQSSNLNGQSSGREASGKATATARLVWVQQQGETLVYGLVRSVSGDTIVLKTGAQTETAVQVSTSTVYARQVPEGAAGSKNAGRTEIKQGSHVIVLASGRSAGVVLFMTPPSNAKSGAGGER